MGGNVPGTCFEVTATTNKAATQINNAKTIHKLLGVKPNMTGGLDDRKASMLSHSILLIDEASYISEELFTLIKKWTRNCKIIFIGDKYQLRAVGCPFSIFEQGLPSATLDIPMRQDENSELYKLCRYLRQCVIDQVLPDWSLWVGKTDIIIHDDTTYVSAVTNAFLAEEDTRILTYHNHVVDTYNDAVMGILGKQSMYEHGTKLVSRKYTKDLLYSEQEILVHSWSDATEGGRGMIRINDTYDCPLGDWYKNSLKALKHKKDWFNFYRLQEQYCEFSLGYSLTTYKSQGSTYDNVFVDVRDIMKCRELDTLLRQLYVGISRARTKVHLYI